MKGLKLLTVGLLLSGCLSPRRVATESGVTLRNPISAKVEAQLAPVTDLGPLTEVAIPPAECGPADAKVAVIDLDGVLFNVNYIGPYSAGENPVATFREKLDAAAADPAVKAVVVRLNSPGGGVAACDLLRHDLSEFRRLTGKPVVALLLDTGAGGAYYVASTADEVIAIPTSVVGGIGVVFNIYYAAQASELQNFFDVSVREGDKVDMGSPSRKLTEEERALFTAMAKEYHARFQQAVLSGRPRMRPDAPAFDGRVMTAAQAVADGLVDGVGYPADAVAAACRRASVQGVRTIMYRRAGDAARSLHAVSPNRPLHPTLFPWSVPGLDRARMPLFMYLWQADPTLPRLSGL